ncbi:50S ribosomal protein L17 [Candidatus Saccharibacteria bacterium]|nr:50S ribosomal protein L17 [Candidatus Saccharibacteria bacterium]
MMHRHGYKGTKFGKQRDQRRALLKSLADSLILRESIETTLPKAKAVASYTERLITKAKVGDLHNRRQVISALATLEAAHKLVNELTPKLSGRNSGYFRVVRTTARRGDNAQMAKVSFVDDLAKKTAKTELKAAKKTKETQVDTKEPETTEKPAKMLREDKQKISIKTAITQAARRTGRRGNR